MRRYETIYILRPSLNEEEINTVVDKSTEIITSNSGTVIELDRWGMKKLAYQIKKESQGFYIYCDYAGTPEAVAEMERRFRIDDAVLRYMTVKTADAITEEEISEATAQAASKQAEASAEEDTESNEETVDKDSQADDKTAAKPQTEETTEKE